MNISFNTEMSPVGIGNVGRESTPKGFDECVRAIREKEEEEASKPGWLPGGQSQEEHHRMEMLKDKAMQIASQGEDGLTPSQMAQIKDIEKEIGKIANLPMAEDLSAKASKVAEQSRVDLDREMEQADEDQFQARVNEFQGLEDGTASSLNGAGMGMLHQNALVTAVKSMSATSSSLKG